MGATSYLGQAGKGVSGLLYGDTKQFLVQVMGAVLCAVWAFGATFIVFKIVSKEVEQEGLGVPAFGLQGYPEDVAHASEF